MSSPMTSPFSDSESIALLDSTSATATQSNVTSPFSDTESIASIESTGAPSDTTFLFSDTDSITPSESVSAMGPPSSIMTNPFSDTESMTSPFSDTESITSITSTSSRRTTTSSLSHASSRTSIDWADARADALNAIAERAIHIAQTLARAQAINEEHAAFIRQLEGEPDADRSPVLALEEELVGVDVETVDSGVAEATAVAAEANLASSRFEMQLQAFLERQRAQAQAGRIARPRFFRRVLDKVKQRFSGLMA